VAIPDKGAWNTSFTELGLQQGFFQDENLDVIIVRVADEAALEKALISGDADIAVAAYLPDILTAWIKGAPVRIISAQATGAPDIFWFARAGGPIRSMKDLPGQPVGFGSRGSLSDFVLHALLNDAGVNDARLVATGTADNGILMVLGAELAASWGGPVAAAKDLLANEVTLIGRGNDSALVRKRTTRVNAASAQFLAGHRALAVAFLKAYKKSVDWAYSSEAALKAYAKVSDQSLEFAKYIVSEFASKASNQIDEIKGEDGSLAELSQSGRAGTALSRDDVRGAYDMVLKSAP
jgi:NitT/TauT family transport system substrate-binding protein